MTNTKSSSTERSFSVLSVLAVLLGATILAYGIVLVPTSLLGGGHIALAGISLLLAGVFATEWAGDRTDLSAPDRRKVSLGLAAFAVVLLVLFVAINGATFETAEFESSG